MRRASIILAIGLMVAASGCSHGDAAKQSRELSIREAIRLQPHGVVRVAGVPLTHAGRILFCSSVAEPSVGAFVTSPQCRRPSMRLHGRVAYPAFAEVIRSIALSDGAAASR